MAGLITRLAPDVHRSRGVSRISAAITTDASGVATAARIGVGFGRLVGVLYNGGLDASASITITDEKTGATIFGPYVTGTEGTPVSLRPTRVVVDTAGTAVTAADTAPNVNRAIYVNGPIKLGVTAGGNAETGLVALIIDESGIGDLALTV